MANNSTVKAQRQSLRNIHYAILTSDTPEGAAYETPQPLVGAISASISPTTNQEKLWADDGVFDIASQLGDITLELELAALPMKAQAVLLGHKYEHGVMVQNASDEAPYVAIGFMSQPQRSRPAWSTPGTPSRNGSLTPGRLSPRPPARRGLPSPNGSATYGKHLHRCQYRLDFLHHVDQRCMERNLHDRQHRVERRDIVLLQYMVEHFNCCQYRLDFFHIVDQRCVERDLLHGQYRFQRHQNYDLRGVDFHQDRSGNRMELFHHLDQRRMDRHQQQSHRGVERRHFLLLHYLE